MTQQRNKPKEAPKAPEKAPFFLPTISGLETQFDLSAVENRTEDESHKGKRLELDGSWLESEFARRLSGEDETGRCKSYFFKQD